MPGRSQTALRSPPRPLALAAPRFRRLLPACSLSHWGDVFGTVALVVVVLRLTGSGLKVAATAMFKIVPIPAFGLFAGAVVEPDDGGSWL